MKPPKEYANELIGKYKGFSCNSCFGKDSDLITAKQCALIDVQNTIEQWEYIDTYLANGMGKLNPNLEYFQQVKTEIQNS